MSSASRSGSSSVTKDASALGAWDGALRVATPTMAYGGFQHVVLPSMQFSTDSTTGSKDDDEPLVEAEGGNAFAEELKGLEGLDERLKGVKGVKGLEALNDFEEEHGSTDPLELEPEPEPKPEPKPAEPEVDMSTKKSHDFKAETKQLLDIVTNSLYTNKEVFLRELISNASDALEKLRHLQSANHKDYQGNSQIIDPDKPLEIRLETDESNHTLTITDTGIGFSKAEMIDHLGTIAKSGSKEFLKELTKSTSGLSKEEANPAFDPSRGIIGKFGVGFYSSFMVADKVDVRSNPAYAPHEHAKSHQWSSDGTGEYHIMELADSDNVTQPRGSSIILHLKADQIQYSDKKAVEKIIQTYSNFINFPIFLNGDRVNTMSAIWAEEPSTVQESTYTEFYKYLANAYDEPLDHLHYRADAPLEIKALFYVPSFHSEKYGMGRMEPGVSLYSRKVLIESKSKDILPEWLRFLKGVVDSEDLPLSISREKSQDSALIAKLRKALTRKFINHLTTMARKRPETYKNEFYKEYAFFLKEGICHDYEFQEPLSKLLYFETSQRMNGELSSLDEYVSRCKPEQKDIYYLSAPTRNMAIQSPYLEAFEKEGVEVVLIYTTIDDFVFTNLGKFEKRTLVSIDKGDIDLSNISTKTKEEKSEDKADTPGSFLSDQEAAEFCAWLKITLPDKLEKCQITKRLSTSPAIITDTESAAMRKMMKHVAMTDGRGVEAVPLAKQHMEINAKHPLIAGLYAIRNKEPSLAKACADQIYDNCLVAAGLMDDSRVMLGNLNDLLLSVVKGAASSSHGTSNDNDLKDDSVDSDAVVMEKETVSSEESGTSTEDENTFHSDTGDMSEPEAVIEDSGTTTKKKETVIPEII